jgi:uncharacterized protein
MIIVDTGFWLALASDRDRYHQQAKQALSRVNEPLITTWCVVTETCYLLLTRMGNFAQVSFLNSLSTDQIELFDLQHHHKPQIAILMKRYVNLPMDLADASLIILAEYLGHGRILSVDQRDFNTYRWKNTQPFQNLLFDP